MNSETSQKLLEFFNHFPGIGPRQAGRFVYHLLHLDDYKLKELSELIFKLKKEVRQCKHCFRYYSIDKADLCNLCLDQNRSKEELMIVAKDIDLETIHKSGAYNGSYFILGGLIPLFERQPEKVVRLNQLVRNIEAKIKEGQLKEIILALSANTEGDYTGDFIKNSLSALIEKMDIKISTLGRGLSTGTEVEYSDKETIQNALKNRA